MKDISLGETVWQGSFKTETNVLDFCFSVSFRIPTSPPDPPTIGASPCHWTKHKDEKKTLPNKLAAWCGGDIGMILFKALVDRRIAEGLDRQVISYMPM